MAEKKRLTLHEFELAVQSLDAGERTRQIAKGVLVHGRSQQEFVAEMGITKGAVSQAVTRVWRAAQRVLPDGLQRVTVSLPAHQVEIVKKWEKQAMQKRERANKL
ncbi:TrfB-related DNA-binding protein [Azohydromonas lata]|uniref:TrfB-related DNA-binding protein n=1 Tax=Azohydromonas lata TaxID=45677 RepID=UPI00082F38C7|nr:TrfB-related DNA-binding protein [Azohydromonas lata]